MTDDETGEGWDMLPTHPNRDLVESMPLILQCSACGGRVGLGDDPGNRAMWEEDFIENDGWARTPEGLLLCDQCAPPREPREPGPPSRLTTTEGAASAAPGELDDIKW